LKLCLGFVKQNDKKYYCSELISEALYVANIIDRKNLSIKELFMELNKK
jgi:hypothetical protein